MARERYTEEQIIEGWRKDYNSAGPHSSLGGLTPQAYAETTAGLHLALTSTMGKVTRICLMSAR